MCYTIFIGEKEVTTPREFRRHFKFSPKKAAGYSEIKPDSCLCQIDIEKSFREHGIAFKMDYGNYYVKEV